VFSLGPGAAPAFGCPGADKIALHVREAAEYRQHQAPGAGAGIGPRLSQGSELRLGVHDALDDAEQVKGAARQPVDARTVTTSPGASLPSIRLSSRRSARAPVTFSR
jgi:hypothetical protein